MKDHKIMQMPFDTALLKHRADHLTPNPDAKTFDTLPKSKTGSIKQSFAKLLAVFSPANPSDQNLRTVSRPS